MRTKVAGPLKAHGGQTVRLSIKLRKGMTHAFCELYSSVGDYAPSPHIPLQKLMIKSSKPPMLNATTFRVSQLRPEREFELVADENCKFYLMQEVDRKGDPLVYGKLRAHGKLKYLFAQASRWFRRDR